MFYRRTKREKRKMESEERDAKSKQSEKGLGGNRNKDRELKAIKIMVASNKENESLQAVTFCLTKK